jgi:phosphonoacetaldehyde hydrolase
LSRLFAAKGIEITPDEARGPMGTEKREHIRRLCELAPCIAEAWRTLYGSVPDDTAIMTGFTRTFIPLQMAVIRDSAQLVPCCREVVAALRRRGIRIGANTGYNREMLDTLAAAAAEQGYQPDSNVCATEVPRGRPFPHMSLKNALELELETVQACVKVDDTVPGIEEGLNAGMWTIAVAISGNEIGLSLTDWEALPPLEQQQRRSAAYARLRASGAHYVIESIADLLPTIELIERRLVRGERP